MSDRPTGLDARIRAEIDELAEPYMYGFGDAVAPLVAVLDLHRANEYGNCAECGVDVQEDPIPAPCRTVRAIAYGLKVEVSS